MTARSAETGRVHILMGLYNGQEHLPAQLQSLAAQTHADWRLSCSDDGSVDSTAAILRAFADGVSQQVTLTPGPRQGFSANYMRLIRDLSPNPGMVAFADQDDLWLPEKLARAVHRLAAADPARPALYCSRLWYWEPGTDRRSPSAPLRRPPGFRNALIENIAQGNTIVLNPTAAALARLAAHRTGPVFAHDWWLYQLITGAGGAVLHDDQPGLLYRQHDRNAIGSNQGLRRQLQRKRAVLRGAFRSRLQQNILSLRTAEPLLTPDARAVLDAFAAVRDAALLSRMTGIWRIGLYRQSTLSTVSFWGGALLGRI